MLNVRVYTHVPACLLFECRIIYNRPIVNRAMQSMMFDVSYHHLCSIDYFGSSYLWREHFGTTPIANSYEKNRNLSKICSKIIKKINKAKGSPHIYLNNAFFQIDFFRNFFEHFAARIRFILIAIIQKIQLLW